MIHRIWLAAPLMAWLLFMPCTNALAQSGDPIVAVAPGLTKPIEISASRLAAYLERHPFVEPKKAVQNIVDIAFLAQSAQSKGLGDIVVLHTWYAVLAEQYLDTFEEKYTAEKLSEDKLKAVYTKPQNYYRYNHPDLVNVDHIVLGVKSKSRLALPSVEPQLSDAKRLIHKLYATLTETNEITRDGFLKAGDDLKTAAAGLGLEIEAQKIGWFAQSGPLSRNLDKRFVEVSFALKTNELSVPFSTRFGWHIVRFESRAKARELTFDDAKAEIAKQMLLPERKREFDKLCQRLANQYQPLSDQPGLARLIDPRLINAEGDKRRAVPVSQ